VSLSIRHFVWFTCEILKPLIWFGSGVVRGYYYFPKVKHDQTLHADNYPPEMMST